MNGDSGNLASAVAPAALTLAGVLIVKFLGDQYNRFNDMRALAASLAGEIKCSYLGGMEFLKLIPSLKKLAEDDRLTMPLIKPQTSDPIFESCVDKIGLLGHEITGQISLFYGQMRAFRVVMVSIFEEPVKSNNLLQMGVLESSEQLIKRCSQIAPDLINKLEAKASKTYIPFRS